ncbi:hypothetical protein B0J13DRAFT_614320 [Dactylonectria estremocensis]|uniref:Uncharacterized protein n=1 Tax=Dactylonectria estremocensis TaxID=1079267 RepID=A0A9P9D0N9_9HYPO|nr:hypothetical protein B0J13DRAFT_614320 [Dactylonectria estremocensis]
MFYLSLFGLFLSSVVHAVPLDIDAPKDAVEWTPNFSLEADDVIVPIDGHSVVMKEDAYLAQLKAAGIKIGTPELDPSWISYSASKIPDLDEDEVDKRGLEPRQASCSNTNYIVTDKTETFVDWDTQMSPVVCAVGDMDISVSSGYSVSNTVGGSAGIDIEFIKDRLGSSLGIDYSRTWTTQTSIITKGTVKDGNCGVMITKPITTRRSGREFRGCVGSARQIGTWYADSHNQGSYNGIKWVEGAISMCVKRGNNPPLSRCHGQGNFR